MRRVGILGFLLLAIIGLGYLVFGPGNLLRDDPLMPILSVLQNPLLPAVQPRTYLVYGYAPYWTVKKAQFHPALTHVSYFSLTIQEDGKLLDIPKKVQDQDYRVYQQGILDTLRNQLPATQKVELTLSQMDQDSIRSFMQDPGKHDVLLADLATILETTPIDGINVDIEYNGQVDETLQTNFVNLIKRITTLRTIKPDLHISVATYADAALIPRLTDPERVAPYVDHIVVMAYDFHRRSSPRSGPVAPLYGGSENRWDGDIVQSMKAYTDVVPSEKILLGIPFYGYEWSVVSDDPQAFTLPGSGSTATYQRITTLLASGKATTSWDPVALSPYLQYEEDGKKQLIYYEDSRSLGYKLDLVKQAHLGGIAIWALGYEGETQEYWDTISRYLN